MVYDIKQFNLYVEKYDKSVKSKSDCERKSVRY